uniref:Integrase catalytic domain-containing protein n=1 Tax=Fagus sylvatica TaxID=28930 RepID=A0A2N9HBP5_FAGSY
MEEEAVSENNPRGARLPTFNHRRIRSEVRAPGGQRGREEQRSYGRIEGRHHSPSKEPSFLGEARKKRRIEELEEELKFLKEGDKKKGGQRQRRRSRSRSGSCGSPKHAPSHKEHNRRSKHRHQRSVSPKRRKLDHPKTPPHQHQHNPVWKKLHQISSSPFSAEIERAKFPARFVPPPLAVYDGKSDPVGHLSRYRQSMALHTSNDPLMCRIFPSSLGEVGLRWFDRLHHRSIRSWQEMSESFTARFITNTRKPKEIDALLALKMKAGETLKSYSARYWEVYNDIDACDEDIVMKTFRFGLNEDVKLRRSLTKRPPLSMEDLMTRLEEHIRVEDDPKSSARTVEAAPLMDKKTSQLEQNQAKKSKRSAEQPRAGTCMAVHTVFKQPIYRLLPFIKDQPYFEWPAKMPGDPATREGKPYCSYHRERGHLTEQCRAYKYHLEQLVKNGHLRQYIDETKSSQQNIEAPKLRIKDSAPIGIIDVIHYGTTSHDQRGEMRRAAHLREVFQIGDSAQMAPVPLKKESTEQIIFTNQDLEGVQVPHSDALGLGLEKKDLSLVEGPLSGFSGETVVPTGKVTINVKAGTVSTPTDFFVLNAFSPYNAILGRPWLHRMGAVPSTLHQRLRFPTPQGNKEGSEERLPQEKCAEKLVPVFVTKGEDRRQFLIGESLTGEHRKQLLTLLEEYQDYKPVVQKARRSAPQHAEAVREEVERLLKVGAVREILYPQWLSNTVVVKKKNGKWRVCVDFTDLNKACPKDPFPLPKIDQLVDSTAGQREDELLRRFPRIPSDSSKEGRPGEDRIHHTPRDILLQVYIDDMVVKSVKTKDHIRDLRKVFEILRRHSLKLNATKCAFGVGSGKFLGFLVTQHGIEANPDQIEAIQGLRPPRNVREVQRLTGMAAALNRFISKSAEKCRPFFDLIKKGKSFVWNEESDRAFEHLKRYLSTPPLLSSPKEGEPLYIYLAASDKAVSAAIVRNGLREQQPVYYTSKTMSGAETRYLPLEKSVLALFTTAKKLPHYFQAHTMIVLTSLPLKALFRSSDFSGRISRWGAHLGAYDVHYRPRTSIKGQVVADFIAEFRTRAQLGFGASNNEAEYEALLHGLRAAKRLGAIFLDIRCDSQLIVNQLTGEYMAKDERMMAYRDLAKDLIKSFDKVNIKRVGREHNGHADSLAGLASSVAPDFRRTVVVEVQDSPSIMKGSPGVCGGHTGGRSLAHRAIGQGYWWPYMQKDADQYVRRCEKCQLFAPAIHKPASQLNPISSPWPFAQWGLDLVGPLPRATGNRRWLIVATDYFTKCFISDNGTQFDSGPFKEYCSEFGIRNHFSSPAYPQGNGQAESSNKTILNGIKKRLEEAKGRWVEELPTILWTFRTTPRSSTGETPYSLTYGVEAVIPLEVGLPTLRSEQYDPEDNELMLAKDMDLVQERRDLAMIRLASYQGDLKKKYGRSINARSLAIGDMVLRRVLGSKRDPSQGKLGANWEGPYQIVSEAGLGAFNLKGMDGKPLRRPWNISNLKRRRDGIKILATPRCSAYESSSGMVERHKILAMLGVSPVNPQVVWWDGIKILATPRCSAYESSSGMVERHKILAMLGVSPVNPQVVWWDGIKILATPRCSAYESSSGMVERHKILAMLGVSPVNPQVVWWDGIKILATPRCSAYESSSGMVERHKILAMLGVSPVNPQVVWWDGIKILATPRCSAYESSSGMVERHKILAMLGVLTCESSSGTAGLSQSPGQSKLSQNPLLLGTSIRQSNGVS